MKKERYTWMNFLDEVVLGISEALLAYSQALIRLADIFRRASDWVLFNLFA